MIGNLLSLFLSNLLYLKKLFDCKVVQKHIYSICRIWNSLLQILRVFVSPHFYESKQHLEILLFVFIVFKSLTQQDHKISIYHLNLTTCSLQVRNIFIFNVNTNFQHLFLIFLLILPFFGIFVPLLYLLFLFELIATVSTT